MGVCEAAKSAGLTGRARGGVGAFVAGGVWAEIAPQLKSKNNRMG